MWPNFWLVLHVSIVAISRISGGAGHVTGGPVVSSADQEGVLLCRHGVVMLFVYISWIALLTLRKHREELFFETHMYLILLDLKSVEVTR